MVSCVPSSVSTILPVIWPFVLGSTPLLAGVSLKPDSPSDHAAVICLLVMRSVMTFSTSSAVVSLLTDIAASAATAEVFTSASVCWVKVYAPLVASGYTAECPTLKDLYADLDRCKNTRARQLALMLGIFANGSLQVFAHKTNVDMNNRLICFNIQSLGTQLRSIAMTSLLEFINMRVMANCYMDSSAAT